MSLADHLREFQRRILICAIAVAVACIAGWYLSAPVMDALRQPLLDVAHQTGRNAQINYQDIGGALNVRTQVTIFIGLVIASPIWLYEAWAFIVPGLHRKERWATIAFIGSAIPLFLAGCTVGWLAFPNMIRFMTGFAGPDDANLVNATTYLQFVLKLMLFIGLGFVSPLVLVLLNQIGILSAQAILKGWRVAVLVAILIAATVTPPSDLFMMFLLAAPMFVLYLLSYVVAWAHDRRVGRKLAAGLDETGQGQSGAIAS